MAYYWKAGSTHKTEKALPDEDSSGRSNTFVCLSADSIC